MESLTPSPSPLVTVVVISYNSSKTIEETLESIYNQTYENLELIVTDDCSKDETADIVRSWLKDKGNKFVYTELVTTSQNTGVSGNINRGVAKSHGEWIKSIAGDDLLEPEAIEEYINFILGNEENIRMCVCDVKLFSESGNVDPSIIEVYKEYFRLESETYQQQLKRVMTELVFVGPTYFYSRDLFEEVGGFSEEYGCAEEWPFVYKVIRGGSRIYAINKELVRYRIQSQSLCNNREKNGLGNKRLFEGMYQHYFDHAFKDLIRDGHLLIAWHYALSYWGWKIVFLSGNKLLGRCVHKTLLAFSPLAYVHIVKRKLFDK